MQNRVAPFASLPDVGANLFPWLPVRLIMRTRLDSAAKISQYHGPLLQSHGDADTAVPYASALRLFRAANEPKRLITVPGADHNDSRPQSYFDELHVFFASLPNR